MKKSTLALTLSTIITLSGNADALELLVVNNYQEAASAEIWKKAKTDQVPEALLGNVSVSGPGSAYSQIFPRSFFQESLFSVCYQDCKNGDLFRLKNGEIDSNDRRSWDVIEQSNVYFWVNKYFNFLDRQLQYKPLHYLRVITNRELRDETKGKIMKNNAFFNPNDISLSFLPASKNIMFKLLAGKINRSGFDPSVVAHEASHYLFHHLFPNPVNDEIGGLNEGFADYIANIFLDTPKVGLVMMHGKALRDSSVEVDKSGKLKTYEPGMEVHDLGERISLALWKSRAATSYKEEMDRLVIDAIEDLGRNPYATIHDFKIKMLERLETIMSPSEMKNIRTIWENIISGQPTKISKLSFLDLPVNDRPMLGFRQKQILPQKLAAEMGMPQIQESNFSILQMEKLSDKQIAILMSSEGSTGTTPYWIAIDTERGNILGIYDSSKRLITDKEEIQEVKFLADKAKGVAGQIQDFTNKVKGFAELAQEKGIFNLMYKIKDRSLSTERFVFNGVSSSGEVLKLELKRKMLTGALLGMPDIQSVELYMLPLPQIKDLPELNGLQVIGYKLILKTGTATEVIMDKYSL